MSLKKKFISFYRVVIFCSYAIICLEFFGFHCFQVSSVFLVMEPRTRISRGFAFVTMASLEDADRCIKYLNQSVLEGRYITVEKVLLLSLEYCIGWGIWSTLSVNLEVFGYIQTTLLQLCWQQSKMMSFIHLNFRQTAWSNGQLNTYLMQSDQLNIANIAQQLRTTALPSTQLINGYFQHSTFLVKHLWYLIPYVGIAILV